MNSLSDYEISYVKYVKKEIEKNNSKYATSKTYLNEDFKSVMVVIVPYESVSNQTSDGVVASFAWGSTYQYRITKLLEKLSKGYPNSKYSVDSNTVNERYYASKSGLGYLGKNSMFISNNYGPNCYIGLIYIKEELEFANELNMDCGNCNKCLESCPTNALNEYSVDCNLCISENLQNKKTLSNFKSHGNRVYGCDECIKVCPHFKSIVSNDEFTGIDLKSNLKITRQDFDSKYKDTTLYWIGYRTFIRNVHIAYINEYKDYTELEFLNESNSEYLKSVYNVLKEG